MDDALDLGRAVEEVEGDHEVAVFAVEVGWRARELEGHGDVVGLRGLEVVGG